MNPRTLINVTVRASTGGLQPKQIGAPCVFVSHSDVIKTGDQGTPKVAAKTLNSYSSLTDLSVDVSDSTQAYYSAVRWFGNAGGTLNVYFVDNAAETPQTVPDAYADAVKKFAKNKLDFFVYWCSKDFIDEDSVQGIAALVAAERVFMASITDTKIAAKIDSNDHVHFNFIDADDVADDPANHYAVGGIAALASQVDYQGTGTAVTLEYKTINGQASSGLEPDEIKALNSAKISYVTNVGADEGVLLNTLTTKSGVYIDDVYNISALANVMQVNVYNKFRRAPTKLGLTENGYQKLIDVGSQTCQQFNRNGVLGGGRDNDIAGMALTDADRIQWRTAGYISLSKKEDMRNLPDSDVSARKFLPLNYKVNLSRAGHTIDVDIEVI